MPRLTCHFPGGYPGTLVIPGLAEVWPVGVEREVSGVAAEYLLGTFPGLFERGGGRGLNRALPEPGTPSSLLDESALDTGVLELLPAIRAGTHDSYLGPLMDAERAGKCRSTVLSAIEVRSRILAG